ncbi:MAG: ROK family transcriptional regulator [Kiritimatiellae bacterium]|nr:ROK family transcriptional regulator [Kiritimatiellia bacterium]MDD5523374.1 ROK family transcriptional regulator [Kiritimatiellia bacterium]
MIQIDTNDAVSKSSRSIRHVTRNPKLLGLSATEFALVRLLRHRGPTSPNEVADALQLTKPTCARLVVRMANTGWITQAGQNKSNNGRPSILWDIVPQSAYVAGLTVGVGKMIAAVADLAGNLVTRAERSFGTDAGAEVFADTAVSLLREVLTGAKITSSHPLLGVGVTAPGMLDRRQGKLEFCAHYRDVDWWRGFPLVSELRAATSAPIFLDYQSNMRTLGEHWFGRNRGIGDMLYISVEMHGVGAGMLVDGQIYRGTGGNAGEFGHMTIEKNGRVCRCGSSGCIETYISGKEIVRKSQELRQAGCVSAIFEGLKETATPTVRRIIDTAVAGDRTACGILEETGNVLGIGIANLVNLLNPALIVIGGELAGAGDLLLISVSGVVKRRALERQAAEVQIVCADSSPDDMVRGAIATVLHETFGSPCNSRIWNEHNVDSKP